MNRAIFLCAFLPCLVSAIRLSKTRNRKSNALSKGPYEEAFKAKFKDFRSLKGVQRIEQNNGYIMERNAALRARIEAAKKNNEAIKERNAAKDDPADHEPLERVESLESLEDVQSLRVTARDVAEDLETVVPTSVVLKMADVPKTDLKMTTYLAQNYMSIGGAFFAGELTKTAERALRDHFSSLFGESTYDIGEDQWKQVIASDLDPVFTKTISGAAKEVKRDDTVKKQRLAQKCSTCRLKSCNGSRLSPSKRPFQCLDGGGSSCQTCGPYDFDCCTDCNTPGCK